MVNLKKFRRNIFLNFIDIEKNFITTKIKKILKIINPKKGKEKSIHFWNTVKLFAESKINVLPSSKTKTEKKEIIIEYRIRGMMFPKDNNSLLKKKSSWFPKYSTLFMLKYFLKKRG